MSTRRPPGFWNWLLGRSDIYLDDGSDDCYMERWRIVQTPWFQLRVHHILRSDYDRALHDHPFDFISLILSGSYMEITPESEAPIRWPLRLPHVYLPGELNIKRAENLHRLVLEAPVWTLVLAGAVRRKWGFKHPDGTWTPAKSSTNGDE